MRPLSVAVACALTLAPLAFAWQDSGNSQVSSNIKTLENIGTLGAGIQEAQKAWKEISQLPPSNLVQVISALDHQKPVFANYIRSAVWAIVQNSQKNNKPIPTQQVRAFLKDSKQNPSARGLAMEVLKSLDGEWLASEIPGFLTDSAPELRREAVAYWINQAENLSKEKKAEDAKATYKKALAKASDKDQVDKIAKQLKGLGENVDLGSHFGFVRKWNLIGPFDNTKGVGFKTKYLPEESVKLDASLEGKEKEKLKWVSHQTEDPYGLVDLNKVLGKKKDSVAYAYTRIESPNPAKVYLRAGCITALKVFVNGKQVFAREEYHHGMSMDQHAAVINLDKGVNDLLIKICQNNQTESWAQKWEFQVRLTDEAGVRVPYSIAMEGGK